MCTKVEEGLAAARLDLGLVVELEKPWASFSYSILAL
jgi:hypothetical protein